MPLSWVKNCITEPVKVRDWGLTQKVYIGKSSKVRIYNTDSLVCNYGTLDLMVLMPEACPLDSWHSLLKVQFEGILTLRKDRVVEWWVCLNSILWKPEPVLGLALIKQSHAFVERSPKQVLDSRNKGNLSIWYFGLQLLVKREKLKCLHVLEQCDNDRVNQVTPSKIGTVNPL